MPLFVVRLDDPAVKSLSAETLLDCMTRQICMDTPSEPATTAEQRLREHKLYQVA